MQTIETLKNEFSTIRQFNEKTGSTAKTWAQALDKMRDKASKDVERREAEKSEKTVSGKKTSETEWSLSDATGDTVQARDAKAIASVMKWADRSDKVLNEIFFRYLKHWKANKDHKPMAYLLCSLAKSESDRRQADLKKMLAFIGRISPFVVVCRVDRSGEARFKSHKKSSNSRWKWNKDTPTEFWAKLGKQLKQSKDLSETQVVEKVDKFIENINFDAENLNFQSKTDFALFTVQSEDSMLAAFLREKVAEYREKQAAAKAADNEEAAKAADNEEAAKAADNEEAANAA